MRQGHTTSNSCFTQAGGHPNIEFCASDQAQCGQNILCLPFATFTKPRLAGHAAQVPNWP